jgi:hypothetical protein
MLHVENQSAKDDQPGAEEHIFDWERLLKVVERSCSVPILWDDFHLPQGDLLANFVIKPGNHSWSTGRLISSCGMEVVLIVRF